MIGVENVLRPLEVDDLVGIYGTQHLFDPFLGNCHRVLTILGSRVSRNPSPSKLKPSTAQAIASPGNIAIQGEADMKVCASFSIRPHEAWGGWVPRPR